MRMAAEKTLRVATEASEQRGAVTVGTTMLHSEDTEMYLGSLREFSRSDARGMWSLAVSEVAGGIMHHAHTNAGYRSGVEGRARLVRQGVEARAPVLVAFRRWPVV